MNPDDELIIKGGKRPTYQVRNFSLLT